MSTLVLRLDNFGDMVLGFLNDLGSDIVVMGESPRVAEFARLAEDKSRRLLVVAAEVRPAAVHFLGWIAFLSFLTLVAYVLQSVLA